MAAIFIKDIQRLTRTNDPNYKLDSLVNAMYTDVYRSPLVKTPKRPWRPPTNYERKISESYLPAGYVEWWATNLHPWYWRRQGPLTGYTHNNSGVTVGTYDNSLKKRAEIGALLKLKDSTINLAQAFGERIQTANHLTESAVRLARAALAVKRGKLREAAGILGAKYKGSPSRGFANDWLAYKYGWMPLISDAYGAVEALRRADGEDSKRYTVAVKKRQSSSSKRTGFTLCSKAGYLGTNPESPYFAVEKQSAFVRLDYYLENDTYASLNEIGILDPHVLAWELMPFSFVADWFVPVGDYLNALTADRGWVFKGGSCSQKFEQTVKWSTPKYGPDFRGANWSSHRRDMFFRRVAYANSPVPSLYIKDPLGGLTSSNTRLLTAVSLLTAVFHKS